MNLLGEDGRVDSTVYRRGADGKLVAIPESTHSQREPKPAKPPRKPKRDRVSDEPTSQLSGYKKLKRHPLFKIFRVLRIVVASYVAFYLWLGYWVNSNLQQVPATPATATADTDGINWLMVGSDSRAGLSKKEQKELKTGKDEGAQRTDTIMIVHIGTDGKTTLVSIPRDSYVKIPAHIAADGTDVEQRKNKINAAYSFGGAPLLVETVELNTGLHIDHYMEVGFAGVRDLTDAVGGVDICVPQDYQDENSGLDIKEGCQRLDGKTALAYVRMRYADPTGDIGRIGRQQQFVSALLHRAATPSVVLHPLRAKSLAQAGVGALTVGENDGVRDIAKFGMGMRQITQGKGEVVTVPISDPDAQTAAGSSVLWDKKKAKKLFVSLGAPS